MALNLLMGGSPGGSAPLSAVITPGGVYGFNYYGTVISSAPAVCNVTGGIPPYTYLWSRLSGSSDCKAQTPTASSTYFALFAGGNPYSVDCDWACTVTDSASTVAASTNTISVFLERDNAL